MRVFMTFALFFNGNHGNHAINRSENIFKSNTNDTTHNMREYSIEFVLDYRCKTKALQILQVATLAMIVENVARIEHLV